MLIHFSRVLQCIVISLFFSSFTLLGAASSSSSCQTTPPESTARTNAPPSDFVEMTESFLSSPSTDEESEIARISRKAVISFEQKLVQALPKYLTEKHFLQLYFFGITLDNDHLLPVRCSIYNICYKLTLCYPQTTEIYLNQHPDKKPWILKAIECIRHFDYDEKKFK